MQNTVAQTHTGSANKKKRHSFRNTYCWWKKNKKNNNNPLLKTLTHAHYAAEDAEEEARSEVPDRVTVEGTVV